MDIEIVLFLLSILIVLITSVLIYRQRLGDAGNKRMIGFYPLCVVTLVWIALDAAKLLSAPKYFAYVFVPKVFTACIVPYITFWFILNFTESKFAKSAFIKFILIAIPVIDNLFLISNPLHKLYYANFDFPDPAIGTMPPSGLLFWIHIFCIALGVLFSYTILFRFIVKNFRRYPILIITGIGAVLPFILNIAFAVKLFGLKYDLSPIGFFCTIVLFAYSSYSSRRRSYRPKIFNDTLVRITKSPMLSAGDIEEASEMITREACLATGANHAGIWMMESAVENSAVIKNTVLYDMKKGKCVVHSDIDLSECPDYLKMLMNERQVVIDDINVPNVLSPIIKNYSPEACAVLDMPIRIKGKLVGIVSIEQHRCEAYPERREWTAEEQHFASSLADFMVIAMESTERRRMEKAEMANKAKDRFLAHMSHEMRTPMNAILGIAEIQLQKDNLSEDTEKALSRIYESGDLLLNIINDILDLSKIEAGKLELAPVSYDIPSLINDTAQLNRMRYEFAPVDFNIHVDENIPLNLLGDDLRIKNILNNILSNAFKYTEKGAIDFSVFCEPGADNSDDVTIIFRVSDTGQGMTKEQISKLFDEYTRFNEDANRETVGTGLGMNITKRLVKLMNGSISVESSPGKGSVFTVRLPQKRIDQLVCGADLVKRLENNRFQSMEITKKTQFIREYMPYGSVLVVDDVMSNIYVAKGMMSPYGLMIETASSGFEAIEKIKEGNVYDIVFMDHMMPKMDGIEAVKIIRGMGYTNTIVSLTANALIGREKMFLDNGFDGFISKPIDSRELNKILNDFIKNKKPPEVVEAARKEQREKGQKNAPVSAQDMRNEPQLKAFFSVDAKNAVNVLENFIQKINSLSDEELKLYITTVHGMKSTLTNIGEKRLSDFALELEKAGEERNIGLISEKTQAFMDELKILIEKLRPAKKEENSVPSEEDMIYLRDELNKIINSCAAYDKETIKISLNNLKQKSWTDKINVFLDNIAIDILHSAFKKASASAKEFISE